MKLLIVGGTDYIYERAVELGYSITLIEKVENFSPENIHYMDKIILLDYEKDTEEIIRIVKAMQSIEPFEKCVTFTERGLKLTADINKALGKLDTTHVVEITTNKLKMGDLLEETEFSIRSSEAHSLSDVKKYYEKFGFPFIVKPYNGVGSQNISLVRNHEDLSDLEIFGKSIVEEYIGGQEYSVEAISKNGRHIIVGITEKILFDSCSFVEREHRFPAHLKTEIFEEIKGYTKRFLDRIGQINGPTHTEIKYSKRGIKIIESHTRLGGDYIPDLVQLSTGIDLYKLTLCDNKFDDIDEDLLEYESYAVIRFLPSKPGTIKKIKGVHSVSNHPRVKKVELNKGIGQQVEKLSSSFNRVGYVITVGDTIDEAVKACDFVEKNLEIIIE